MSKSITLTVPMPPNIANRQMHHMVKHRAKLAYWALLDLMYGFGYNHEAISWIDKYERGKNIPELATDLRRAANFTATWIGERCGQKSYQPKPSSFKKASIRSTMYLGAVMDEGNAMNRHKWVEDWLTERGFIADDRKKCLTWEGLPEQIIKRDGNYRIIVTLTPITN